MKVLAIQASPNIDGLTATMAEATLRGAQSEGADIELFRLQEYRIEACRTCDEGWGRCRSGCECVIEDDFAMLHQKLRDASGLIISTPVYFGDISEAARSFLDRLRRCEWGCDDSQVKGTPFIAIAAAGGSGGGVVSALASLERYAHFIGLTCVDLITVTRRSKRHKLPMVEDAGRTLVQTIQPEP